MRYIKDLSEDIIAILKDIELNNPKYRVRDRVKSILLSNKGFSIPTLSKIFDVDKITIYKWFDSWDSLGINGLYDKDGKGRKRILSNIQEEEVKNLVREHNRDLNRVKLAIKENLNIEISKDTIKRIIKRHDFSWLRVRKNVNGEPIPEEYEKKKKS